MKTKTVTSDDQIVAELLEHGRPVVRSEVAAVEDLDRLDHSFASRGQDFGELGALIKLTKQIGARRRGPNDLVNSAERIGGLFGESATYSFKIGGKAITGPTVHLVESLAAEYGWLWSAVTHERDEGNRVHLAGLVIDVLSGHCVRRPYAFTIAPAKGGWDRNPEQRERWRTMQMQVAYSKATRTALEHALPRWYVNAAIDAADRTMRTQLPDRPIEELIGGFVAWFGKHGVSVSELEDQLGSERALWVVRDVVTMRGWAHDVKEARQTISGIFGERTAEKPEAEPERPTTSAQAATGGLFARKAAAASEEAPAAPSGPTVGPDGVDNGSEARLSRARLGQIAREAEERTSSEAVIEARRKAGIEAGDKIDGTLSREVLIAYCAALEGGGDE